jgi:16S rRNA (cytosine967-C5)-methyltransferase
VALAVLHEWHRGDEYAVALIDEASVDCGLEPRDTALLQTLVYSVIRHQSILDHWAGMLTEGKMLDRETLDAIRMGLSQLLILDMKPHAAVNETVEYAGRAGALVNAVLRRAIREKNRLLEVRDAAPAHIRYSHPKWLVQRWAEQFGEAATIDLCAWNQQPAPIYVRLNRLVASKPTFEYLDDHGDDFYSVERVPADAIEAGECYVQDPSTAMAAELLAPSPSHSVLDACAAPGGKTALMAQLMRNDGRIIATDTSAKRLERMARNMQRLHVNNVSEMVYDWLKDSRGPKENKKYDRILLDVPCSNTGVMRRRIDVRWRLKPEDIKAQAEVQLQLLQSCLHALASGGVLVYSTCSIDKEENEQVVQKALDTIPGLSLIEIKQTLPHRDGVDGAFAAALRLERELPPRAIIREQAIINPLPQAPAFIEEIEPTAVEDAPLSATTEFPEANPIPDDEIVFDASSEAAGDEA